MGFGSFISGALPVVGSVLEYLGQDEANRQARSSAREQMSFQERMSGTAHQREVEDLRKAGLNPILSAGGSGASSPGGAGYDPKNVFEGAGNTALSAIRLKEDIEAIRQGIRTARSQERVNESHKKMIDSQKVGVDIDNVNSLAESESEAEFKSTFPMFDLMMKKVGLLGNSALGLTGTGASLKYLFSPRNKGFNNQNPFKVRRRPE